MSIAEQEKQINQIINDSKKRLRVVEENLTLLDSEKNSIEQDIVILTQRLQLLKNKLGKKKSAYNSICNLSADSENAFQKIKESTKTLLLAFKKEQKKIQQLLESNTSDTGFDQNDN